MANTTIEINGKEYTFNINVNTSELYYQTFNEDLIDLSMKSKDDNMILVRRNRIAKLAYITNMQSKKTVRELCGHLSVALYLEWSDQFDAGTFIGEAGVKLMNAWIASLGIKAQEKNPVSPQ